MNINSQDKYKLAYSKHFITILVSIVLFYFIAKTIAYYSNFDHDSAVKIANNLLIAQDSSNPEPLEKFLFITGIIFFPFSLLLSLNLMNRIFARMNIEAVNYFYYTSLFLTFVPIVFLFYFTFSAENPFANDSTINQHDYLASVRP